jgi:hypothetical protein
MFANIRRQGRRLTVSLAHSRRVGQKVLCDHIGYLGSVALPEPISLAERGRFWDQADARLAALSISPADAAKVRATIAGRIPPLGSPEMAKAILQRDVMAAFDLGPDAMREAAKRLMALARSEAKEPA